MKLVKFYQRLLASLNVEMDESGLLSYMLPDGSAAPISVTYNHLVHGKTVGQLYMPTQGVLDCDENPKIVKFHPTGEDILRGRSEVLNKLLLFMTAKLSFTTVMLADAIFRLAVDTDKHAKLPMAAHNLLSDIDLPIGERDLAYWNTLLGELTSSKSPNNPVLRFKLVRNGKVGDEDFNRVASINPILLKNLGDITKPVFGKKPPNRRAYENTEVIFKKLLGGTHWIQGTRSNSAPYFEASLLTFIQLAEHLNGITAIMGKNVDQEELTIDVSWAKDISKISDWHDKELPFKFPGNVGSGGEDKAVAEAPAIPAPIVDTRGANIASADVTGTVEQVEAEVPGEDPIAAARRRIFGNASALAGADTSSAEPPKPSGVAVAQQHVTTPATVAPVQAPMMTPAPAPAVLPGHQGMVDVYGRPVASAPSAQPVHGAGAEVIEELSMEQKLMMQTENDMRQQMHASGAPVHGGHPPGYPPMGHPGAPMMPGYPVPHHPQPMMHGYPPPGPGGHPPHPGVAPVHMGATGHPVAPQQVDQWGRPVGAVAQAPMPGYTPPMNPNAPYSH